MPVSLDYRQVLYQPDILCCQQAREGEFRVPQQEQSNLDTYSTPQSREEEVRYPTIGKRKPAAAKVSLAGSCMGDCAQPSLFTLDHIVTC